MVNPPPPPAEYRQMTKDWFDAMSRPDPHTEEVRRLQREIQLKKLQVELNNLSAAGTRVKTQRQPIDIYERQITAWYNGLPPTARVAPRTMAEFINMLEGRTPGMRAHAGDVSRVLRRLGWTRKRIWSRDGEGHRVWNAPITFV